MNKASSVINFEKTNQPISNTESTNNVAGKLEDSWKKLEMEISESFEKFSKDYYVVFE